MARISVANALAGIRNAVGAGGQLRAKDQLSAVVDALLQLVGNANIAPGNSEPADPLNSPFTIYVNPYIGTDRFVGGSYNWFEEPAGASDAAKIRAKLRRLENQRLTCGYSKQRPFRTINRVAIEIVLATSKSYFTLNSEDAQVDCPAVEFAPGTHIFYNDPGNSPSAIPITEWPAEGFEPTPNHLIAFNPNSGGIVLPRYATASAPLSLRQCTVRPSWVPAAADEAVDYSNRAAILKITNTSYVYGLTFRDQLGANSSHHLIDCFQAASQADLNQLYAKVRTAMGGASNSGNISNALAVPRLSEYEIVGPFGANPSEASDTVKGASPYVYNCSLRTEWGMGGAFWDGARVTGLKSIVIAQFTGISLQRDLSCWQIYREGAWRAPVNYQELIDSEADDVRMKPQRMSRHVSLISGAFGQMVSVFAIGAGRHHFADSGAQLEFSNSTSNFGGCVAVAKGYAPNSDPLDQNWNLRRLKVARSVADQTGNVRQIGLGNVAAISGSLITLQLPLAPSDDPAIPAVLAAQGYSLPAGTLIWIENPGGPDWRATLAANAWVSTSATEIDITGAALQAGTNLPIGTATGGASLAVGRKVYIRRLWDNRSSAQRRVSLRLANTTNSRVPVRNSILQTRPGVTGGGIDRVLAPGGAEVLAVTTTTKIPAEGAGVVMSAEITIRRSCPDEVYAAGRFYRKGETVKHAGKHFTATVTHVSAGSTPDEAFWQESYVQQASDYNAEDPTSLEAPQLIFDTDTDGGTDLTTTCGINWATIYTSSGSVRDQLRSATDYRGALAMLLALGFSSTAAHNALVPRTEASRELDPASATDFPTPPSGGAASGRANWALEFRQPSFIQLLGQNLNGVGFWNYTRALPRWRRTMSARNEFNANFAPEQGGRVEIRGTNKDGFDVTNQGLINTDTGEVIGVDDIGKEGDTPPPTRLDNLTVDNLTATGKFDVNGVSELDGGDAMGMTTNKFGFGQLAPIADYLNSTVIAANDEQLSRANNKLVSLPGLNRWRQAQRLVSAATGTITIYVQSTATDRTLDQMFDTPPTSPVAAIPTLARAAEYANAVIGSGNQTAEIRIAPGLYDPASVWECNVVFRASDPTQAGWPLIFPETGDPATAETWFDGSGYGNLSTRVNFRAFTLFLRDSQTANNQLHVSTFGRQMRWRRGVDFRGGFHFLGVSELIKLVAEGAITAGQFITGSVTLPSGAFTTNTATNVDTFLNQLRISNGRNPAYDSWTTTPPIQLEGNPTDVADLRGIVFGSPLPSRKDSLGAARPPYIATNGLVQLRWSALYLRGNTTISSAGMGVTNDVPMSGDTHYGSTSVAAPWTWRQFHHTFLGPITAEPVVIDQIGSRVSYLQDQSNPATRTWHQNSTNTRYLPNHIHLLTSTGAEPADNDSGPFLDQFIHAKRSLSVRTAFLQSFSSSATGNITEGFVGRFGSNGYNSVKVRGVLLGNEGISDQERGATVLLGIDTRTALGPQFLPERTIFKVAGLAANQFTLIVPKYGIDVNSAAAGVTYQILSLGSTTQANWNTLAGTSGLTYAVGNRITAAVNGSTLADTTGLVEPFYGEPHPLGASTRRYNPVITNAALNQADSTFALNMALRSYARGISPEHGFNITPNVVL
jgi:hypothetical protein